MILVDFSGTIVAAIMSSLYLNPDQELDEARVRWSVLSSLKSYKATFKEYGDLVIACDGKNYWRKEIFPYYKCKRKKSRDEDKFDWTAIFKSIEKIKGEVKDFLPYPLIEVNRAEADDVIAVLVKQMTVVDDKVLIISRDKDLKQLQKYPQVKQFNPVEKVWLDCPNPRNFLHDHIITGDTGDSIPNIFSDDNSFAIGKRQSPATAKRMVNYLTEGLEGRYELNEKLIDLEQIPSEICWNILGEYESQINKGRKKLLMYLLKHDLSALAASLQDF
jgi:hypothetical protein